MRTLQGNFLHIQHVYLCPKVVEDACLFACNVAGTHNHQPAPNQALKSSRTNNLIQRSWRSAHMSVCSTLFVLDACHMEKLEVCSHVSVCSTLFVWTGCLSIAHSSMSTRAMSGRRLCNGQCKLQRHALLVCLQRGVCY